MKNQFLSIIVGLVLAVFLSSSAYAVVLGKNITIFDGQKYAGYSWYVGQGQGNEDEETEPWTSRKNKWDLEGMFLDGGILTLVGEWDFINGEPGASGGYDRDGDGRYTSGDLFIDVAGYDHEGYYGYDYVFDVDWTSSSHSYSIYRLAGASEDQYDRTTYRVDSNPWKFNGGIDSGANKNLVTSGNFTLTTGLTNGDTGFLGNDSHNAVSFNLSDIFTDAGISDIAFTAHFTMECGNDNLMGTAPVPEPATIILMGIGLLGIGTVTRKKIWKNRY